MSTLLLYCTVLLATLGSLLMAGVFFAFSTAVMPALGRIAPGAGMQAMQTINAVILNPVFLSAFMGTALLAVVAAVLAWLYGPREAALLFAVGALAYCVGVFGITAALNVPMNETLAKLGADGAAGHDYWEVYLRDWTFWNGVRTLAGVVSGACMMAGVIASP